MMPRLYLILLLPLLLCTGGRAQNITLERQYPSVTANGRTLDLAWLGGLNAPQYQTADLDGNGTEDLLIFDRTGDQFLAIQRFEDGSRRVAPELLEHFPAIQSWVAVRDYNLDGVPDLFAWAQSADGIEVHRGRRGADGRLRFELVDFGQALPVLYFPFSGTPTTVFVTSIDYPSIEDVDFDGDLDILTFSAIGGYMEYYRNVAVERGLGADTLVYMLADQCYGGFFESGRAPALDLATSAEECSEGLRSGSGGRPRHSGSTVLSLDYDGNGLMDLLLGDVSFPGLVLGLNNGTTEDAYISEQDSAWQQDGVVADIPTFPAAYHIDVDLDGDRDIVASPSVTLNGADVNVGWLYTNAGSDAAPDFQFVTQNFLTQDMIDLGTSGSATSFDYDADGKPDLILSNNDEYTGTNFLDSRIRLYRNVTSDDGKIAFELIDEDYFGLGQFQNALWAYAPAFGDMDGDGDVDAIVGERSGKMLYFENRAGAGNRARWEPPVFEYQGLDAGQFAKPTIADLDRDGLPDLIVGGFDGRIRFYRNIGTASDPAFAADVGAEGNLIQLGGVNTNAPGISTGHPTPAVIQHTDYTLLLTGNRDGFLEAYRFDVGADLAGPFVLLSDSVAGVDFGAFSNPGLGDFDGDGALEIVVGNERGGFEFFRSNVNTDGTVPVLGAVRPDFDFSVFPNPTDGSVTVTGLPRGISELTLLDVTGREIRRMTLDAAYGGAGGVFNFTLGATPGVYLLRARGEAGQAVRRVVVR